MKNLNISFINVFLVNKLLFIEENFAIREYSSKLRNIKYEIHVKNQNGRNIERRGVGLFTFKAQWNITS